jgi:hypothetical protein
MVRLLHTFTEHINAIEGMILHSKEAVDVRKKALHLCESGILDGRQHSMIRMPQVVSSGPQSYKIGLISNPKISGQLAQPGGHIS